MHRHHVAFRKGGAVYVRATFVVIVLGFAWSLQPSNHSLVIPSDLHGRGKSPAQTQYFIRCSAKLRPMCCRLAPAMPAKRPICHALPPLTGDELACVHAWEENQGVLSAEQAAEKIKTAAFPIEPEDLILRSKLYLATNQWRVVEPDMIAEDFVFCGPVVGPLGKDKFIEQLGQFDLQGAFPDMKVRWYDFSVDPYEPSRVWFRSRSIGTNTGVMPPVFSEATNKAFSSPPEVNSLRFNENGQVVEYTAAYSVDRRQGSTGGLGGIFGIFYGIGKPLPYPEAQPYVPSWQRQLFGWLTEFATPKS